MRHFKNILFTVLAVVSVAQASLVLSADKKSDVQEIIMGEGKASIKFYWQADDSLEKMSITGEGIDIVQFFGEPMQEEGVLVQKIDKSLTQPQGFQYDYPGDAKLFHKDRSLIKMVHFVEGDVVAVVDNYKDNKVLLKKTDTDLDGVFNEFMHFDSDGKLIKAELDRDNDGVIDETLLPGKDF